MVKATQGFVLLAFLFIAASLADISVEATGTTVDIPGAVKANLRFSQDFGHLSIDLFETRGALMRKDQAVQWHRLFLDVDQKEYMVRNLLDSTDRETRVWTVAARGAAVEPGEKAEPIPHVAAAQNADPGRARGKSPPLIQMFEGREDELVLWVAVALGIFFVGWICGGNFYRRRDRIKRTRLRF